MVRIVIVSNNTFDLLEAFVIITTFTTFLTTSTKQVARMVRGGPANRAVKRAKVFALTKVKSKEASYGATNVSVACYTTGVQRSQKELLQFSSQSCT